VKRYVEAHYDERLTLATTARVAGFEKTYFSAWFHARAGVRYRDWLSWVRICQALRLMRETDSSLTDICFAVGFGDLRTFERAFERCTGECPRSARRHATTVSLAHAAKLTNPKI
jgi:AraC-like DNA-binding protein